MPVLGNVKLIILSERMLRTGSSGTSAENNEKLVVRWKTCAKSRGEVTDQIKKVLGRNETESKDEDFHGLFIFEFDDEGRISSHTIEHVEEGNNWEKTTTVISVTDWLLGKAWGTHEPGGIAGLAFCDVRDRRMAEAGEKKSGVLYRYR
jgi:Mitochondrial protein up-regulated during meiosis